MILQEPLASSLEELSPVIMAGDGPALVTVPNVPIVSTGTYRLGANWPDPHETTFTSEDLQDMVTAAMDDPGVRLPRLKLGHTSEWGDAEPAFGKVDNLRLDANGTTVYGDFVGVPAWLAEILPTVYPNRSIEAAVNVKTPTGKEYNMVLGAVSLLGVVMPGVSTLEDLAGFYSEEMPEEVEIEAGELITASIGDGMKIRKKKVEAQTSETEVRRTFYEEVAVGDQVWWWIREIYLDPNELIVDSDEGPLYRIPFEVNGEEVTFGEAQEVKIEYVAADGGQPTLTFKAPEGKSCAVFASRSESRPESTQEEDGMKLTEDQLKRLGLSPDASDEDVTAALDKALAESQPAEEPAGDGGEIETPEPDEHAQPGEGGDGTPEATTTPEPVAASGEQVLVDKATLEQLRAGAQAGTEVKAALEQQQKNKDLSDAIQAGKFPPSRKDHYSKLYDADPAGTRELLASLEAGIVPVQERGGAPEGESAGDAYPETWFPEVAARQASQGRRDPVTTEA